MLDLKYVEENETALREMLAARRADVDIGGICELIAQRRQAIAAVEVKRAEHNRTNQEIARAKKAGQDAAAAVAAGRALGDEIKKLEATREEIEARLREALLYVPNVLHPTVPRGEGAADNVVRRAWGEPRQFDFEPRPHWEIAEKLGILDAERAVKIAGTRFVMTVGAGAWMERALANLMLDEARARGYVEINPPLVVLGDAMTGTGQLPKFGEDMYKIEGEEAYLIPTAEVPVTNVHRAELLEAAALPKYYCSHTPCFRREAGAPGRDTRGMMRVHQFNKVELVKIVTPDTSYAELEALVRDAAHILERLDLPYRETELCSADLGFGSAKTVDLEVWLPSEGGYREISSCSNYEEFQARRMNLRFRPQAGAKPRYPHTLNGSALAIGRTVVAILENYQNPDGSVVVPAALRPYMGGVAVLPVAGS